MVLKRFQWRVQAFYVALWFYLKVFEKFSLEGLSLYLQTPPISVSKKFENQISKKFDFKLSDNEQKWFISCLFFVEITFLGGSTHM